MGDLQAPPIYTPLLDTEGKVTQPWIKWLQYLPTAITRTSQQLFYAGSHAQRLHATTVADGSLWYETDRTLWYVFYSGAWHYSHGTVSATQATLPADLTARDAGVLAFISDYAHALLWSGGGWKWAPGEFGSGYVENFVAGVDPGIGWQACDGSLVTRLKSDGTLEDVTVPVTGIGGSFGGLKQFFRR